MERIAIAMQDGGAGVGARYEAAARAARPQPHFVLPPNLYNGPPGRGGATPRAAHTKNKKDREAHNGCCPCGHRDSPVMNMLGSGSAPAMK